MAARRDYLVDKPRGRKPGMPITQETKDKLRIAGRKPKGRRKTQTE